MTNTGEKSLYIHIPFCAAKCDYCDFFSIDCGSLVPDSYIDALLSDLSFQVSYYGVTDLVTVYIGGGTPSMLSAKQMERLLNGVMTVSKSKPLEVTMEMNPESLTLEKLVAARDGGVSRLSLGIQSLNDTALKTVHRHCNAERARKTLSLVNKNWDGDLSLDAIAGLPNQNETEYLSSLEEILSYNPNHFSLYTLTVEEGTKLFDDIASKRLVFDQDIADEQWIIGKDLLLNHGFEQYEVSNFSKNNHISRHNMTYWLQNDYICIGSGACGSVYRFDGVSGTRWTNTQNVDKYIDFWVKDSLSMKNTEEVYRNMPCERESLSLETQEFEYLMMGLRCTEGVSSDIYRKRYSGVAPWKGDLSLRLGEKNGAWNKFSKHVKCYKESIGEDERYFLKGDSLMFLNTLLSYLT